MSADIPYGTEYPDQPWIDRDGLPMDDDDGRQDDDDGGERPVMASALLTRSGLRALPDAEPLIDNVLDHGTTALLYGRWGTGKSFIALDWSACVATGKSWQGRTTEQRRVLYVAAEGAFGLKARIEAWETGWNSRITDEQMFILPRAVNLTNGAHVRNLAALVDWGGYGLVVFDTLARCMVGADENSAKDCGVVVDVMNRIREATPDGRGVVLGVHHTGKDGKTFRGSSVFEAGADTVYSVNVDGHVITLDREKRKDGEQTDRHTLKIDPIPGTGSVTISAANPLDESVQGGGQIASRAARLLSTFVHHFVHTGATKVELRNVADMPPATFHRALSDLLQSGELVNNGSDKRPFYRRVGQ